MVKGCKEISLPIYLKTIAVWCLLNTSRFRVQPTYGQAIKKRNPCRSSAFSFRKLPIRQVNNFFLSDLIEIIFSCLFGRNQQIIYTLARAKFQPSTLIHSFRVRPTWGYMPRETMLSLINFTTFLPRFRSILCILHLNLQAIIPANLALRV